MNSEKVRIDPELVKKIVSVQESFKNSGVEISFREASRIIARKISIKKTDGITELIT